MSQPSPTVIHTIRVIDTFSNWSGKAVAWLILPLVFGLTYEGVARYLFNAPTEWAFDLSYMLYGTIFMLGAHYALLRGAHIRTDILWDKFSDRKKGIIDAVAYIVFFFPGIAMFFFASVDEAWHAFKINELSEQTAWRPILWPFKAVVPLAAVLLLIQGVSELLKSLYAWRTGRLWAKREIVEI
ncbi:MAG: TRAP transporter small permease subunit [Candidatus Rokubacteria bacterium]|nr:TRAP transporter small permease subunit [Candidatus Rokubacteria bacterium]